MLRVSYVNPIGYVTKKTTEGKTVKLHLCTINDQCWAEIQPLINDKGEKDHYLCMFFCNTQHIKNCANSHFDLSDCHYHFNTAYTEKHTNETIYRCLTQMGAKVTLYYKKYKKTIKI